MWKIFGSIAVHHCRPFVCDAHAITRSRSSAVPSTPVTASAAPSATIAAPCKSITTAIARRAATTAYITSSRFAGAATQSPMVRGCPSSPTTWTPPRWSRLAPSTSVTSTLRTGGRTSDGHHILCLLVAGNPRCSPPRFAAAAQTRCSSLRFAPKALPPQIKTSAACKCSAACAACGGCGYAAPLAGQKAAARLAPRAPALILLGGVVRGRSGTGDAGSSAACGRRDGKGAFLFLLRFVLSMVQWTR